MCVSLSSSLKIYHKFFTLYSWWKLVPQIKIFFLGSYCEERLLRTTNAYRSNDLGTPRAMKLTETKETSVLMTGKSRLRNNTHFASLRYLCSSKKNIFLPVYCQRIDLIFILGCQERRETTNRLQWPIMVIILYYNISFGIKLKLVILENGYTRAARKNQAMNEIVFGNGFNNKPKINLSSHINSWANFLK